jgi:hypothetical protein
MFKGFAALDKGKTFRPRRHHKTGTKRYELHKHAQATLGAGNLHDAVTLPEGEDANEWLAVNTVDFFNEMCAAAPDGRSSHRQAPRPAPGSAEANHAVPRRAPQQPAVRDHRRVLHGAGVPRHVRRAKVRVHVGGRHHNKKADQLLCAPAPQPVWKTRRPPRPRTADPLPLWTLQWLRPRLHNLKRRLCRVEARRGLRSPFQLSPKSKIVLRSPCHFAAMSTTC